MHMISCALARLRALGRKSGTNVPIIAFGIAALLPVEQALAQPRYVLAPFASRNGSLDGTPIMLGASLTTYGRSLGGILGMRVGGAYDVRGLASSPAGTDTERGWVADADAVISPARFPVIGPLLGGFLPTVFSGIGVEGIRRSDGTGGQGMVGSYGAGVSRSIGGFAVETEARRRVPVTWSGASDDANAITRRGWEYRVGFSIGFGGSSTPRDGGNPPITFPTSTRGTIRVEPAASASASAVIATGDDYLGTRYSYGGAAPQSGFDCSGFVQYVYRRHGVTLPRTSRQQSTAGKSLPAKLDGVRAGDLLFFSQRGDVVDHVAIYAGNNRILHSSSSGGGVRYDDLGSARGRWFVDRLVAARRVLGEVTPFIDPSVIAQLDASATTLDPPDKAPRP